MIAGKVRLLNLLVVLALILPSRAPPSAVPAPGAMLDGSNIVYVCSRSNVGRTNDISAENPNWTNITPPAVGTLADCVPDPWKPQEKMWLASGSGIWKGENLNTATPLWTHLRTTDQIRSATDGFTQNGSEPDRIIASLRIPGTVFVLYSHGGLGGAAKTWVGRSTDDGLTWSWSKAADEGEQARDFGFAIWQNANSPDAVTVWASARLGHLYTSTDGGQTFRRNLQLPPSNFYQLHAIYAPVADPDGSILYVADGSGTNGAAYIYRTLDGGATWTNIAPVGGDSQPRGPLRQYEIAGPPSSSTHLYALVQRPQDVVGENKKLYYSADRGASWILRYDFAFDPWPFDVLGIGLNALDENRLYVLRQDLYGAVSSTLIYSSSDGGTTWSDKSGNWKANVDDWTGAVAVWDASFIATTYTISGRVTYQDGTPLSGVTISDSTGQVVTTDAGGAYMITTSVSGSHTLTPSKSGYTFSPSSRVVVVPPNATGQDFTATPLPTVSIEYMEVTQSVQCLVAADCWNNQLVPLIQGKPTLVRLYLKSSGANVSGVQASLSGSLDGQSLGSINSNNQVRAKSSGSRRTKLSETLYFILPNDWLNGTTLALTPTLQCNNCIPGPFDSQSVTFEPGQVPIIRLKPVRAKGGPIWLSPNVNRGLGAARVAEAAFPSRQFDLNTLSSMDFIDCDLTSDECQTELLIALDKLHVDDKLPPQAKVYGLLNYWVPTGDIGGLAWLPGKAAWGKVGGLFTRATDFHVLAQEVAHTYGVQHVPGCGKNPDEPYDDYPWDDGHIGSGSTGAYGFETSTQSISEYTAHDFMTYCQYPFFWNGRPWISDFVYAKLREGIESASSSSPVSQSDRVWSAGQEFVIVSGLISATNTVELFPSYLLTDRGDYVAPEDGLYAIELRDSSGNLLASQTFTPSLTSEGGDWGYFVEVLPWPSTAKVIRVVKSSTLLILAEQTASANPPGVSITWPNGGETLGGEVTLTWNASDPDGDSLTYTVQYSADNGSTWTTLASSLTDTAVGIDTGQLAGSSVGLLRVIATDGLNTAQDDSDGTFVVPTKPPVLEILAPLDGTAYLVGDVTVLEGSAYDLEDGILEESALAWTSSLDGGLGAGSIVLASLSPGQHIITLTATDNDGNVATDSLNVFVGYKTYLPLILK